MNTKEMRSNLRGLSLGELAALVEQQTEVPSQDAHHTVGMVLLWSFAHDTQDDSKIAAGLGIPIDIVFAITSNALKSRIWEKQLDIDDGITFLLMINAAMGELEYFPETEAWKMTENGKKYIEEKLLSTPEGADLMRELKAKVPKR